MATDLEDQVNAGEGAPVIRIANAIVRGAIGGLTTSIILHSIPRGLKVIHRINDEPVEVMSLPLYVHAPLIAQFKIMAGVDITKRDVCQMGTITIRYEGKDYQLKVTFVPTRPLHLSIILIEIIR
jgi:type IV pilus assembly protein PilB